MYQVDSVILDGSGPDLPTDGQESVTTVMTEEESALSLSSSQQDEERHPSKESIESIPEKWTNQTEFLMSCISMSVGLGNVWRFPYIAYNNGGGAFLIPYIIVLTLIGRPIYFLELCLGQFTSYTQIRVWNVVPFFRGVGFVSLTSTVIVLSYYCAIVALTTFYFFASFSTTLPWTQCNPDWKLNCTEILESGKTAEYYFVHEVLKEKTQILDGIGFPDWRLSLSLLVCWIFICCALIRGVKSSGKVAYVTTIFPYVILIALMIRGFTLEGAWIGIKAFIAPNWIDLLSPRVWYEAVSQCFFSLNTGFGSVIMFASYNPFSHNIYRDAMILSFLDTATSLIAGFVVFSVLGFLSVKTGKNVTEILGTGGSGLAFVTYPTAISQFPLPQLFAVLFFLMLFFLGIGSAMGDAGAVVAVLLDRFPRFGRVPLTIGISALTFAIGLFYVTPGGQFILTLVDYYGVSFVVFITSILEIIGISWVYGINNFTKDIEFMLGRRLGWYWIICWSVVIPLSLIIILIYSLIDASGELTYNSVPFPVIATVFGWILCIVCVCPLVICAVRVILRETGTPMERLLKANKPSEEWGPRSSGVRRKWEEFKENYPKDKERNTFAFLPKKMRCAR